MTSSKDGATGAARRSHIEAMLANYPDLNEDQLAELLHWFRTEASALDVATVASNEAIVEPYRRFREDHIDRLTGGDALKGLLFASAVAVLFALIIWQAL